MQGSGRHSSTCDIYETGWWHHQENAHTLIRVTKLQWLLRKLNLYLTFARWRVVKTLRMHSRTANTCQVAPFHLKLAHAKCKCAGGRASYYPEMLEASLKFQLGPTQETKHYFEMKSVMFFFPTAYHLLWRSLARSLLISVSMDTGRLVFIPVLHFEMRQTQSANTDETLLVDIPLIGFSCLSWNRGNFPFSRGVKRHRPTDVWQGRGWPVGGVGGADL